MRNPEAGERATHVLDPVWIPMPDGSHLAARIVLPVDSLQSPVPAVLEYLPYRRGDGTYRRDAFRHPYLAAHGFAAVRVDMRGSGDSDGILYDEHLPQAQADACAVIAWLADQPWCTGAVGMFGISWGGFNALQVAAHRPPALKAIITLCSTDDRYADDVHYMGGCMLSADMLAWASVMLAFNSRPPDPAMVGSQWRETWLQRIEETPRFVETWLQHPLRDAYWQQGSVCEDFSRITCPVYAVGGWADGYTNAVFRLLAGVQSPRKGLIGPWAHAYPEVGEPGPAVGFQDEAIRWWKHWLCGESTGIMDGPILRSYLQDAVAPARWYDTRPGQWVADMSWPSPAITSEQWYFGPAGLQTTAQPGQIVSVHTDLRHGADAGMWCSYGIPGDYAPDQRGEDGRASCFDGPIATETTAVLGFPSITLRIAADQPVAQVAIRLCDVGPDGSSLLVSRGVQNLTHRGDHTAVIPCVAGEFVTHTIMLNACGHILRPGHRWRVALSPSYWPHIWPSPLPVTLTVDTAGCVLELPVRTPQSGDATAGEFAAPAGNTQHDITVIRAAERARYERIDHVTGECGLHDESDAGAFQRADGLTYAHRSADRQYITPGEPLSARCVCEHTITVGRDDWQTRVETWSALRCDATDFIVENRIVAYDGATEVNRQVHTTRVPRHGI